MVAKIIRTYHAYPLKISLVDMKHKVLPFMPITYPKVPAALYEAGNTRGGGVLDMHMCKIINLPTQLCVQTIHIYIYTNSFGGDYNPSRNGRDREKP
jgi:hypothetical protein